MSNLRYQLRNLSGLKRSLFALVGAKLGAFCGAIAVLGILRARIKRYYSYVPGVGLTFGAWEPIGFLSARKVTQAGVVYLVAEWVNATNPISNFKYHECGTGVTAEANTDTALVTPCTTVLNPDSTRAVGTQTAQSGGVCNNVLRSVGTLTFDGAAAVTEHGLFSAASTGTLWDRSVFSAINVASGDSIEFTYECTVSYEA